ncbi:MAG: pre-peptidase C-terminal domain-containing protein [Candidatus Poseidoniales archaeon]
MGRSHVSGSTHIRMVLVVALFLFLPMSNTTILEAKAGDITEIEVLHTVIHPDTNITYHLLSEGSWEDSANVAKSLGGFLVTIDNETEEQWIFDTFAFYGNQTRHLWIGLHDSKVEGEFAWHDGTPFIYRNWGEGQPSQGGDEDYVHITGTNMGNIEPGTWNDLENDPQYFPVYGVVQIGLAADYSLQFSGEDYIESEPLNLTSLDHELTLSADIYPYSTTATQFIFMNADYGFGMYLSNGYLAYSDEYSLSKNPKANANLSHKLPINQWSNVAVTLTEGVGGGFYLNGELIQNISSSDAQIPLGDFGSNECYEQNLECDEFIIGKMGAACDCNYFDGLIDNIQISSTDFGKFNGSRLNQLSLPKNGDYIAQFYFNEGSGPFTLSKQQHNGTIFGASWVLPDGTIVAQVVELFSDEYIELEDIKKGDIHIYYIETPDFTKSLSFFAYSELIWNWEGNWEDPSFVVYTSENEMPTQWTYQERIEDEFGYMGFLYEWPEQGQTWFLFEALEPIEYLTLGVSLVEGTPPPDLEDMTELQEGIPVPSQSVRMSDDWSTAFTGMLHYYVNVTEPLADLRIRTYGGEGNVDLGISYYTVPDPFDEWFYWDGDIGIPEANGEVENQKLKQDWSSNMGNDEEVHLYDVEPGLYYITAYTYRRANDFTIVADFTYPPSNIEPETAIQLIPGEKYGLLSGYDELYQYFKVDVPTGTERLVVDLSDGKGEASLYMRLDLAPTETEYDYHSNSPGAGDKIAFNDPTPGTWYILLSTPTIFSGVNIVAEFEDRFVWDYDGEPIQLFNAEPIEGLEIPESKYLDFFIELTSTAANLEIRSYGGSGDVQLILEGEQLRLQGGGGPNRGDDGMEAEIIPLSITSENQGTNHNLFVELLPEGIVLLRVSALTDTIDVGLVAKWQSIDIPIDIVPDEEILGEFIGCKELAEKNFESLDTSNDGVLDLSESNQLELDSYDMNNDKEIEFREFVQIECNCANEIENVLDSYDGVYSSNKGIPTSHVVDHDWLNQYSFDYYDNNDDYMNAEEFEIAKLLCTTTYNAFDSDGDGVNDIDDAFPEDPSESKDSDNDGVGDNADIAPMVANDMLYSFGGVILLVLMGLLVMALRNKSNDVQEMKWNDIDEKSEVLIMSKTYTSNEDSFITNIESIQQQPPQELMGMVRDGTEILEYPSGSGIEWQRGQFSDDWTPK